MTCRGRPNRPQVILQLCRVQPDLSVDSSTDHVANACRECASYSNQVVRYSALIGGIAYGVVHARTLQKKYDEHEQTKCFKLQQQRVKDAKAAYAKLQEAKRPAPTSGASNANRSLRTPTTRTLTSKSLSSRGTASNLGCADIASRGHDALMHALRAVLCPAIHYSATQLCGGLELCLVSNYHTP